MNVEQLREYQGLKRLGLSDAEAWACMSGLDMLTNLCHQSNGELQQALILKACQLMCETAKGQSQDRRGITLRYIMDLRAIRS